MPEPPMIRTSERKLFRKCPQAWWWSYVEGLVTKGRLADELWFGTGIHFALAEWYGPGKTRGPHPADTWEEWVGGEVRNIKASKEEWYEDNMYTDAEAMGVSMLERYIDHYGADSHLETIAIEQPFQVEIVVDGKIIAIYAGTFDGVFWDEKLKKFFLWEHKTAASISTEFLALDDQAGGYFAVASETLSHQGLIPKGQRIAGVRYNYLRKAAPDERPQDENGKYLNMNGSVSKKQPGPYFYREDVTRNAGEVKTQLRRLSDEARWMNAMRNGTAPLIKNTNYQCPRCPFFDLCKLEEKGSKAYDDFKRLGFSERDPYADHRKSAYTSEDISLH